MKRIFASSAFVVLMTLFVQAGDNRTHRSIDPDTAYKNNCMRCHASTQQYSPRMTRTIVMHMRVRANLTEDQAQAILEYLTGGPESVSPAIKGQKPAGNNGHQDGK